MEESNPSSSKKRKVTKVDDYALECLPCAHMYEKSYMHRDIVSHLLTTVRGIVISASVDGFLKFWKLTPSNLEFVRAYRAHAGSILHIEVSEDGQYLATIAAADKNLKIFDINSYDMIRMIKLDFQPGAISWIYAPGDPLELLAVAAQSSTQIHIFDVMKSSEKSIKIIENQHKKPITIIRYNSMEGYCISVDEKGMIEYWSGALDGNIDCIGQFPKDYVTFKYKTDTDLIILAKKKLQCFSLELSKDFQYFATNSSDKVIRIFSCSSGKIIREFSEAVHQVISDTEPVESINKKADDSRIKRVATERDYEIFLKSTTGYSSYPNAIFDESGQYILYPTSRGIKVCNISSGSEALLIGDAEDGSLRWARLSLWQGNSDNLDGGAKLTFEMIAYENPAFKTESFPNPSLLLTAFNRSRIYLLNRREPKFDEAQGICIDRDVMNERLEKVDSGSRSVSTSTFQYLNQGQAIELTAVLHTEFGDIFLELYPEIAPKAVENFVTHARQGYYNKTLFHRVIKGFMIQGGDPSGDGTGGQSIWGKDFENEISSEITFSKPFLLSMANSGHCSNGSQFFITVLPCPWLQGKHTIFGRCSKGMDVVQKIENAEVDKRFSKPLEDIYIIDIEIIEKNVK